MFIKCCSCDMPHFGILVLSGLQQIWLANINTLHIMFTLGIQHSMSVCFRLLISGSCGILSRWSTNCLMCVVPLQKEYLNDILFVCSTRDNRGNFCNFSGVLDETNGYGISHRLRFPLRMWNTMRFFFTDSNKCKQERRLKRRNTLGGPEINIRRKY